jgi:hypothetical protein
MAFIYGVAFLVALRQNKALIGDRGITPARNILYRAEERGRQKRESRLAWREQMALIRQRRKERENRRFNDDDVDGLPLLRIPRETESIVKRFFSWIGEAMDRNPRLVHWREVLWDRSDRMDRPVTTILWMARDRHNLNPWLDRIALSGLGLACAVFALGAANVPILLALWICQRSLMAVGGFWYGYGWEPQLAEVGFHAMFLVPFWSLNPFPALPLPPIVNWTLRWHLFRVSYYYGFSCLWYECVTMLLRPSRHIIFFVILADHAGCRFDKIQKSRSQMERVRATRNVGA